MKFGEMLKNERTKRNVTVYRLAQMSGIPQTTIHSYEKDGVDPTFEKAVKLLRVLGIAVLFKDTMTKEDKHS